MTQGEVTQFEPAKPCENSGKMTSVAGTLYFFYVDCKREVPRCMACIDPPCQEGPDPLYDPKPRPRFTYSTFRYQA